MAGVAGAVSVDDVRGYDDYQLVTRAIDIIAAKELADDGEVAQHRQFRRRPRIILLNESSDDQSLIIAEPYGRLRVPCADLGHTVIQADQAIHHRVQRNGDAVVVVNQRRDVERYTGLKALYLRRRDGPHASGSCCQDRYIIACFN